MRLWQKNLRLDAMSLRELWIAYLCHVLFTSSANAIGIDKRKRNTGLASEALSQ